MDLTKQQRAWAVYDWANSAFSTCIVAGFFPIMFKLFWADGMSLTESTQYLGMIHMIISIVMVISAPFIGQWVNQTKWKRRMLIGCVVVGAGCTALLCVIAKGQWQWAASLFIAANLMFSSSLIIYDGHLSSVAKPNDRAWISSVGYAWGYLGGALILCLNIIMILYPSSLGLSSSFEAMQWACLSVGIWWFVFSIPLFNSLKRSEHDHIHPSNNRGHMTVKDTLKTMVTKGPIGLFLIAYWLYIDGVFTVIKMALDFGLSIGLSSTHLMGALVLVQCVGFPSALGLGALAQRWQAKPIIYVCLGGYGVICICGALIQTQWHFYVIAIAVGVFQGGIQALSRSYFSTLIPQEQSYTYFGYYNMVGKMASIMGPFLIAASVWLTGSHRISIILLTVLFILGGMILYKEGRLSKEVTT